MDLSSQTLETLRDFILHSSEGKKWLNNQSCFELIEKLYSKSGKHVKVTNENNCIKCELKTKCSGIRLKDGQSPIIIENNGELYRVCKIEELDRAKRQLEESKQKEEPYKHIKQNALELTKIAKEERNCFACKHNLAWKCKGDSYAHCGAYKTMRVSENTPPDAAKTCKGFHPQ